MCLCGVIHRAFHRAIHGRCEFLRGLEGDALAHFRLLSAALYLDAAVLRDAVAAHLACLMMGRVRREVDELFFGIFLFGQARLEGAIGSALLFVVSACVFRPRCMQRCSAGWPRPL